MSHAAQPYLPATPYQSAPAVAAVPGAHNPTEHQLIDAQKFTKYALSALQFDDVPTAIKNLKQALTMLTGQSQ
jgi:vacuolar protein sorting-associated protein VTA1